MDIKQELRCSNWVPKETVRGTCTSRALPCWNMSHCTVHFMPQVWRDEQKMKHFCHTAPPDPSQVRHWAQGSHSCCLLSNRCLYLTPLQCMVMTSLLSSDTQNKQKCFASLHATCQHSPIIWLDMGPTQGSLQFHPLKKKIFQRSDPEVHRERKIWAYCAVSEKEEGEHQQEIDTGAPAMVINEHRYYQCTAGLRLFVNARMTQPVPQQRPCSWYILCTEDKSLGKKAYRPNDKGKIQCRLWLQEQKGSRGNFVTWWMQKKPVIHPL